MRCFRSFNTAERTLEGVEALHMMGKGQVKRLDGREAAGQAKFVGSLFGVAALSDAGHGPSVPLISFRNTAEGVRRAQGASAAVQS